MYRNTLFVKLWGSGNWCKQGVNKEMFSGMMLNSPDLVRPGKPSTAEEGNKVINTKPCVIKTCSLLLCCASRVLICPTEMASRKRTYDIALAQEIVIYKFKFISISNSLSWIGIWRKNETNVNATRRREECMHESRREEIWSEVCSNLGICWQWPWFAVWRRRSLYRKRPVSDLTTA